MSFWLLKLGGYCMSLSVIDSFNDSTFFFLVSANDEDVIVSNAKTTNNRRYFINIYFFQKLKSMLEIKRATESYARKP